MVTQQTDRMLRRGEVLEICGIGAATLYRRIADAGFPKPKAMGSNTARWSENAVRAWLAGLPDRVSKRNTPPGAKECLK